MWTFDENLGRAERQHALTLMGELGLRLTNVSGAADMVIGRLDVQKGTANVHNGQTQFIQHEEDGTRLVLIEALLQGRPFDATGRLESVGNGTGIKNHFGLTVHICYHGACRRTTDRHAASQCIYRIDCFSA